VAVENGLIGFSHETLLENAISILKLRELSSIQRARAIHGLSPRSSIGTHERNFDLVFLSPRLKNSPKEYIWPAGTYPLYSSPSRDLSKVKVKFHLKPEVLDHPNLSHANTSWDYGAFRNSSWSPDQLSEAFQQKKVLGGEFLFKDHLPIDPDSVELWVPPEARSFVLERLTQELGPPSLGKTWESIVHSESRSLIVDVKKITDSEFYARSFENSDLALRDLFKVDRARAIRLTEQILKQERNDVLRWEAEKIFAQTDFPVFLKVIARRFKNSEKTDPSINRVMVKLSSLAWTPTLQSSLKKILPSFKAKQLENLYWNFTIHPQLKNTPYSAWMKNETKRLLQEANQKEILRNLELKERTIPEASSP